MLVCGREKNFKFYEGSFMTEQQLLGTLIIGGLLIILLFIWNIARARKFSHLNQVYNELEVEYQSLSVRINEREEYIKKCQHDLAKSQNWVEQLRSQIEQSKVYLGKKDEKLENLQLQLEEVKAQLTAMNNSREELLQSKFNLQNQLSALEINIQEKTKRLAEQQDYMNESKAQLKMEFQNLANKILEEKTERFNQSNQSSINDLLKPFREQIEGFQKRVNEIHSESLKGNASIEAEIKKMFELGLSMNQEANNLTSALKGNKKILGNWGEMQLEQSLQSAGLEENVHYVAQAHYINDDGKNQYPDFVLNLPDNKHLIIDSKMSLVAYENAVGADDSLRQGFLNEHCQALRQHIDDLSRKNYSGLKNIDSPNFVLMFIALEPAYIEALKNDPLIFDYGFQKNVIMVSHTTLMPILRTVANLWRLEKSNREAIEINDLAGDLYNQLCIVVERLKKLGATINTATKQYNETVVAFAGKQGLMGKAERFQTLSTKANKQMPELNTITNDDHKSHLLEMVDNRKQ